MTIREFAAYLTALPDQDQQVAFAEWHNDGWHIVTPLNLGAKTWSVERYGETHCVVLSWDNCPAHKISEQRLKVTAGQ